jgi:hypothetical protein
MRKHFVLAMLLASVFGFSALASAQKQLDITLEGPWILFTSTMNPDGTGIPVLVAVAPLGATDTEPIDEEDHFHHSPQLSSGNGFYLPRPSSSSPAIFCLAFDRCAPDTKGSFPTPDPNYTAEGILTLKGNNTNKQWRSYGTKNDVVILPMPTYYHADGIWPIQFHGPKHDPGISYGPETDTIGLVLHYSQIKATRLKLFSCPSNVSSADDCKVEAQDDKKHPIEVTNTGTLRLQMRAPDTTSNCDHHVRYGFHQMLTLLDPNYKYYTNYRYIEPAKEIDPNDTNDKGIFETSASDHPCFDGDPDDQDYNFSAGTLHQAAATKADEVNTTNPFTQALDVINAQFQLEDARLDGMPTYESAKNDFYQALGLRGSLRISDVNKMGAKAALSAKQIRILIAELQLQIAQGKGRNAESEEIPKLEKLRKLLKGFADYTKNGADCRAAQLFVQ